MSFLRSCSLTFPARRLAWSIIASMIEIRWMDADVLDRSEDSCYKTGDPPIATSGAEKCC